MFQWITVKLKESEKSNKYQDLAKEQEKTMEYEDYSDTNQIWNPGKETRKFRNSGKDCDHPDYSTAEINWNTRESNRRVRRLAVTYT